MKFRSSAVPVGAAVYCCTGLFCGAIAVADQSIDDAGKPLEHVLVTVPIHRTESTTALPVTVLSGDELRDHVAGSIGETLADQPGLANASFGPSVGQPVIRGQQGARVMVLQNSTASADASTSSADHAVSVEPVLAESIEVLRGPATLLYGGGAIGGVVNVIDKRIPTETSEALTGAAEIRHDNGNDETAGVVAVTAGTDRFALHVDGLSRDSNDVSIPGSAALLDAGDAPVGYIANTDSEAQSFSVGGSYFFERGYIGVAVNRLDQEYGIPAGAHEDHDHAEEAAGVRIDLQQTRYDLRADYRPEDGLVENLRWFATLSDYRHQELEGAEVGTRFSNDSVENRVELLHQPIAGWHGVLGVQAREFEYAAIGEESFIPVTDVNRLGIFILEDYHYADLVFELGARWDGDELSPDGLAPERSFDSFSYSGSVLWQLNEPWSLGLAMSRSERAPVIEELYSNAGNSFGDYVEHVASGAIELGNDSLDSEQSTNVDVSLSFQRAALSGYLTIFFNDFSDYIYLANTGQLQDETAVYAYRQADARFRGAEFSIDWALGAWRGVAVDLTLFGDRLSGELKSGEDIPRLPPQRIGSRVSVEYRAVTGYLSVLDAKKQDKPGNYELPTAGYTRWDAGVGLRWPWRDTGELLLFVKLKNLTDEEIRNAASLLREVAPEPGRSLESGFRVTF